MLALSVSFLIAAVVASRSAEKSCEIVEVAKERYQPGWDILELSHISLEKCKKVCLMACNCSSFDYRKDIKKCWISDVDRTTVELSYSKNHIYYEKSCDNEPCVCDCIAIGETLGNPDVANDLSEQTSLALEHGRVSEVTVYDGDVVDSIELTYGTYQAPRVGGHGGAAVKFTLDIDEVITEVSAQFRQTNDEWNNCLAQLTFVTSKGNKYGPYGTEAGDNDVKTAKGDSLLSFRFGGDDVCLRTLVPIFNTC